VTACSSCGRENPAEAKLCSECGASLAVAGAPTEQRRVVTVVFSDVTGSTALGERLDPESLRRVLARYFEVASQVVERHGGSVEKFIVALALLDQDRLADAEAYIEVASQAPGTQDANGQAHFNMAKARLLVRRGQTEDAVRLAAEAIAIIEQTEELLTISELLLGQTEVLERAGRVEEAKAALSKAADIAARKGALVDEQRAQERLTALEAA
jgi:class 3 adenylate cyclase